MGSVMCQETNGLHHTTFLPTLKVNLLVKILTFSGKCPQSLSLKASIEKEEANLVNPAQVLSWKRPFLTTLVERKGKMEAQNSKFSFSFNTLTTNAIVCAYTSLFRLDVVICDLEWLYLCWFQDVERSVSQQFDLKDPSLLLWWAQARCLSSPPFVCYLLRQHPRYRGNMVLKLKSNQKLFTLTFTTFTR